MNPDQYTDILYDEEAFEATYQGAMKVIRATVTSLGPLGRNVLLDYGYDTKIVHDGVSIASLINPQDSYERAGAKVIQEAAKKQRDAVGDGTTAVLALAGEILTQARKLRASGVNPMLFRKGLESGALKVTNKLQSLSTPVKTLDQKIQIATISAEDPELGKLVAETIHKIGEDGILTVEESKASETFVEHQEGMQIDKGYAHSFMMTDPERQIAVLEDCHVLITDHPLNTITEIGKFLEQVIFPNTKKVLFIAPEIGVDFMQVLLGAKIQGAFLGLAMRAPGIGSQQTEMLQDLCALTGATLITKEAGMKFDDQQFTALGKAQRIVLSKISTIITNGGGHKDDILQRIQVIRKQLEDETISDYDREQLKGRLGKLTNGVAVIKVAGQTDIEMKERKERAIDAVQATQAACKYGLVPGGEVAYLSCLNELDETILGEKILKEALKQPFRKLVENAGHDGGEKLAELKYYNEYRKLDNIGFDVVNNEFVDMIESGIIDPTSVSTTAVKTAISVSNQIASLGAAVVQLNQEKK